jgi:hypothetical protein
MKKVCQFIIHTRVANGVMEDGNILKMAASKKGPEEGSFQGR